MRKFSKLILAILPVSSLTVFSVVSCSTNDKKPVEIPKTPNNKTPDNQPKKPEDQTDKENHNIDKPSEEKQTDGEPSPGKPNNPSHNQPQDQPKEPKTPGNNNSNGNSSEEQPQGDEPQHKPKKVDFTDLESLKRDYSFQFITQYNSISASSGWIKIKSEQSIIFKNFIFKNNNVLNNYQIELDFNTVPEISDEKGMINKVGIKFTKDTESKIIYFTFNGFKPKNSKPEDRTKNKNNYITPKKNIDKTLLGLYPSLVAYMLLYTEEGRSNNKYDQDIKQVGNVINFDELTNNNKDLFTSDFKGFGPGTKELLFDYKEDYRRIYKDKITKAKYDDLNGELELEVQITNTDEHTNSDNDPIISIPFSFKGFRKVDLNKPNNNGLALLLTKRDFKDLINDSYLKDILKHFKDNKYFGKSIPLGDVSGTSLKNDIFDKLIVQIDDSTNNIYNSSQTLGLSTNRKSKNKSILGLKNSTSLYPFHTRVNKDSIKNISISMTDQNKKTEATIEFELHLPIYVSTLSDLTSESYAKEDFLKLKNTQTTEIE
ncbi:LppA family lipoprotein [Mycoplasma feriruminatoris]|uniref:LppA family lipoprotein n=1 Tax=Mycoplasma feriruminatoris TaxID=1179777 RepID=UPI00241CD0D0|nr:LppA family lipoprotein [Mycoplasma feriruminatoris]WFQ90423.1 hypothetical protein MFERI11561_00677 [Mycoplasma feriruminatoris]